MEAEILGSWGDVREDFSPPQFHPMKTLLLSCLALLGALVTAANAQDTPPMNNEVAVIKTTAGEMVAKPITVSPAPTKAMPSTRKR